MKRARLRTALLAGAVTCAHLLPATDASAQTTASAVTADQAKAQEHFQRAKELYQEGRYNDAVAELELARGLDPSAKDLVFNLGIVHEKLGRFDDALGYFRQYLDLSTVTPAERTRAEGIIKRIEGAKQELPVSGAGTSAGGAADEPPASGAGQDGAGAESPETPRDHASGPRGRIDAATIAVASLAVVGLGVGTGFGISALATRPEGFVTGRDGNYADFVARTNDAHTLAVISDVGFGVGIVAAAAAAWLYFGRPRDAAPARTGVFLGPGVVAGSFP